MFEEAMAKALKKADLLKLAAQEFGRLGGKARAKALPPERRREIARRAVLARWSRAKKIKTTKKGW